jgi:hypothetical protein
VSETAVRVVSLATKIKQVTGLAGTSSVSRETNEFLETIEAATHDGRDTSKLKAHEVVRIERIWDVYFA